MDVRAYLEILRRRIWVILITAAITVIVALIGTLLVVPEYSASATVRVATAASGSTDYVSHDINYADRLMNTYIKIATSGPVLAQLVQKLNLERPPRVDIEVPANTELMKITVEDQNPTLAKDAANILADILIAQVREQSGARGQTAQDILTEQLSQTQAELDQARKNYESVLGQFSPESAQGVTAKRLLDLKEETHTRLLEQYERIRLSDAVRLNTISIVEPAVAPATPSKPQKALNLGLGLFLGLVAGVGLAFLLENMDTTLHTSEQIARTTGLPMLGRIPTVKRPLQNLFINNNLPLEEAFRRLRINIMIHDHSAPLQTFLVTSAQAEEGKSTIVTNLARVIAQSGRTVLLADCNLRSPTLHSFFGLPNQFGLSSVLQQKISSDRALQESNVSGLYVLTSGPAPSNPTELLGSARMPALLERFAQHFDIILLDTPALLPVADTAVLATAVDGVVLVVRRTRARYETVWAACQQLADIKATILGVVVNRAERDGMGHSAYYHHKSSSATRSFHMPPSDGTGAVKAWKRLPEHTRQPNN
jgi:succinoglycan biosynthesis transport protein ExoP